tara:strand:+ start:25702 stop:25914 length:213 start_codon:yes stop_codon:yes gene_type:complete
MGFFSWNENYLGSITVSIFLILSNKVNDFHYHLKNNIPSPFLRVKSKAKIGTNKIKSQHSLLLSQYWLFA